MPSGYTFASGDRGMGSQWSENAVFHHHFWPNSSIVQLSDEKKYLHFLRNFRESNKPALVSYHVDRERYPTDLEGLNSGA